MEEEERHIEILQIPDETGYWLLRADGGKYYSDFFLNNFVAISDNEISFEMILDKDNHSIAGITIDHYKELYKDNYPKWTNQQIAHAANRTEKFVNQMKVGDLVIVPSKRSMNFLLGVIDSDVFEITDDEVVSGERIQHAVNPYLKRRKVNWLKEVSRYEISVKLHWILSAHQTIFDLSNHKDYINQLMAPVYVQNGMCHGSIQISKQEGLDSDEWFELYSIIKKLSDINPERVTVKTDVQSPGLIEFVSENAVSILTITIVLSGVFFGEVNILGIKLKGILPYYQSHKKNQLEIKHKEKEIELMDENKKSKQIENERAQFEFDKEKESLTVKKETETAQLREQLRISSFDAGRTVGDQMQTDNSENQNEDEL